MQHLNTCVLNVPFNSLEDRFTRDFFDRLKKECIDRGRGLVPLIGAGISAPSGVPLITQLSKYLQRCVAISVGVDIVRQPRQSDKRRSWRPRTDTWPPVMDPDRPLE